MKYGIISDVHGNLDALERVLDFMQSQKTDIIMGCGDMVGYGPQPNECIEALRSLDNYQGIMGNHEWEIIRQDNEFRFNKAAIDSLEWTRANLKKDNLKYISNCGIQKTTDDFICVHANPLHPLSGYLLSGHQADKALKSMDKNLCFIGHTHVPGCFKKNKKGVTEDIGLVENLKIYLEPDSKYIVNAGSVGQPRDGNPEACLCIYDSDKKEIFLYRIPYDIKSVQNKIINAGLPNFLAYRLSEGL